MIEGDLKRAVQALYAETRAMRLLALVWLDGRTKMAKAYAQAMGRVLDELTELVYATHAEDEASDLFRSYPYRRLTN